MDDRETHGREQLSPTQIAYALVLRIKLEDLPALKTDLETCFERHKVAVYYERASTAFLRIVEEPFGLRDDDPHRQDFDGQRGDGRP